MTARSKPNPADRLIRRSLLSWYHRNKRDLPWRHTRDPYHIWVSEIMLQQTQVSAVIPYYVRFIRKFPSVRALARARLQTVLKHWEGLGYYSRARNFHRAAGMVLKQWRGRIPGTPERLESLPGVGRSTAGAIASIAFGRPAPILDGNVKRVLCRLFAVTDDPKRPDVKNRLWERSGRLLPADDPGSFNQALMDLGATVCLPRNPDCGTCPVEAVCRARQLRIQDRIPVRQKTRPIPNRSLAVAVILNGDRILTGPRPEDGMLAGLWGFPESSDIGARENENSFCRTFGAMTGLDLKPAGGLAPLVHVYTHQRVTYRPRLFSSRPEDPRPPWRWIKRTRLGIYPFSGISSRILARLFAEYSESEAVSHAAETSSNFSPAGGFLSNKIPNRRS
jgi:A/G-specific adenine glycosylase